MTKKKLTAVESQREELLKKQEELQAKNETLLAEMQKREYELDFKDKKIFDSLFRFIEKDAPWGHTTAAGLIMLFANLKEQKPITTKKSFDGKVMLRATNVSILWQMVSNMTGNGFHDAKNFVRLMSNVGQSLSEAVQKVHEDNQELRDNHTELAEIDQELDRLGVEGAAEETKEK